MNGVHCCTTGGANSRRLIITPSVVPATASAAVSEPSPAVSDILLSRTDMTVAASSINTVPVTVGVMILLSSESRWMKRNSRIDETSMVLASSAGPPSVSAAMTTAMNAEVLTTPIA